MDWKSIGKKLLFPPGWLKSILTVLSTAALIWVFVRGMENTPVAYAIYVLAFYTLLVVCVFLGRVLPKRYKAVKEKIYNNPIGNRYLTDAVFRTHISLYASLGVNLLYAGLNLLFFWQNRSMWFVILAGYYTILAVMRFLLVRYVRRKGIGQDYLGELKNNVICSGILLTVNFVLSGAVLMILYQNRGFEYHGILIYVMAVYTFYITIHAIINLVKYRRYNSPVMTTTKAITFSAALVSMLSLETAMFSQFGQDMAPENKWLMIALTGAGVSITVVTMSIYMMVKSIQKIKRIKENQEWEA